MEAILADPVIQSSAIPLLVGLVLCGVVGFATRRTAAHRRLAVLGVPLAFIAIHGWLAGVPGFPPQGSTAKLFWCVAGGALLAAVLDSFRPPRWLVGVAVLGWLAGSLYWLLGAVISSPKEMVYVVVLAALSVWVAFSPDAADERGRGPVVSGGATLSWALALGGVTLVGASSAVVTQLSLALGAVMGGFMLWNWPWERHDWAVSGRIAVGVALLLTAIAMIFTSLDPIHLLPALPCLIAGRVVHRLPFGARGGFGRALAVAVTVIITLLPAAAAVAVSYALSSQGGSPY